MNGTGYCVGFTTLDSMEFVVGDHTHKLCLHLSFCVSLSIDIVYIIC